MTHTGESVELRSPALAPELMFFLSLTFVAEIQKARGVRIY